MLEAVLNHVNLRARIPLCGMISQYKQVSAFSICSLQIGSLNGNTRNRFPKRKHFLRH